MIMPVPRFHALAPLLHNCTQPTNIWTHWAALQKPKKTHVTHVWLGSEGICIYLHGLDSGMRNAVNFVFIDDDDEEEDRFWECGNDDRIPSQSHRVNVYEFSYVRYWDVTITATAPGWMHRWHWRGLQLWFGESGWGRESSSWDLQIYRFDHI